MAERTARSSSDSAVNIISLAFFSVGMVSGKEIGSVENHGEGFLVRCEFFCNTNAKGMLAQVFRMSYEYSG